MACIEYEEVVHNSVINNSTLIKSSIESTASIMSSVHFYAYIKLVGDNIQSHRGEFETSVQRYLNN